MLDYVLVDKKNSHWKWNLNMDAVKQVVEMCEYALNFDKQGYFKKLYDKISKNNVKFLAPQIPKKLSEASAKSAEKSSDTL